MPDSLVKKSYVGLTEGRRRSGGIGRKAFLGLVEAGLIGRLSLPGLADRYDADDIDAVFRAGIRPATANRELELAGSK